MNLAAPARSHRASRPASTHVGWLLIALGLAIATRALSTPGTVAILVLGALAAGWRPARPTVRALAWGLAGAGILVAGPAAHLVAAHGTLAPSIGRSPSGFVSWGGAVAVVVTAEEAFLRGALWQACERRGGAAAALVVSALGFAFLHVPVYGWTALPLDTAVGVLLGGLRLATGSVGAPAVAHVVADWAGWWLV